MAREETAAVPPRSHWPSFLRGGERGAIFARLSESDPLRLGERSARRLRERWLLIDPDRAHARAVALCADGAASEEPPRDLAAWTLEKIDLALEQLLRTDEENERNAEPPGAEELSFPLLTNSLMITPEQVRRVAVAFNALEPLSRRAFFELLVEGRDVLEVLEQGPWDADGLHDHVTRCLGSLGYPVPPRQASLNTRFPKPRKEPQ